MEELLKSSNSQKLKYLSRWGEVLGGVKGLSSVVIKAFHLEAQPEPRGAPFAFEALHHEDTHLNVSRVLIKEVMNWRIGQMP